MTTLHLVAGISVLVLSLVASIWGGVSWLRSRPSVRFWYVLRAAQVAVGLQTILGALLIFFGHESADELHYVYGGLPLIVSLIGELARAGAAAQEIGEAEFEALPPERQREIALAIFRRETGIMAVSCIVIFFLALRAAGTSSAF